ncbi:DEKNAAC104624 [Brettanomyces naardenensis]|uniref:DEKNAAC104624 n=1 Tax=Brettanomyces naardenensis TaxID=13370 RepID=A0A448YRG3_BRENA|nr:DEKNAAC104624 [Brettanomyces naardenensis]
MVELLIIPRSKNLKKINCDTEPNTRVQAIINAYAKVNNVDPNRVKLSYTFDADETGTKKPVRKTLKNYETLEENGLDFSKTDTLSVGAKDVGPQIGWRTVYFIEYLGPVVIQSLIYFLYYDPTYNTFAQKAAYIMTLLHYLKREYESLFIHVFSVDTMPVNFLFRNCGHYWIFNGLLMAFSLYAPQNKVYEGYQRWIFHVEDRSISELEFFFLLWLVFELSNLYCHWQLRQLRSDGSRKHRIPHGFFFDLVSFPNYFFESLGWLVFAVLVNNWSAYLFFIIGTGTMMSWAGQKHKKYREEFGDQYPKNRKAMIPYIF